MKFGAREICDVVLKAVVDGQKVGDQVYKAGQPVMYFDSLKTSSMEQASTTVYAQGGKGNSRLISWDGDKTITFTMEDALLSPLSLAILAKAGLTEYDGSTEGKKMLVHCTQRVEAKAGAEGTGVVLLLDEKPEDTFDFWWAKVVDEQGDDMEVMKNALTRSDSGTTFGGTVEEEANDEGKWEVEITEIKTAGIYFVDYYTYKDSKGYAITIEPESFEGNFYLEASTLFRAKSGLDLPAEFIIPLCKPQSNMTFAMSGSGDPSTFTFTMDAFPGYTKYNPTKKVLAAIQIIDTEGTAPETGDGYTQF